jgi:hypothetical protein
MRPLFSYANDFADETGTMLEHFLSRIARLLNGVQVPVNVGRPTMHLQEPDVGRMLLGPRLQTPPPLSALQPGIPCLNIDRGLDSGWYRL